MVRKNIRKMNIEKYKVVQLNNITNSSDNNIGDLPNEYFLSFLLGFIFAFTALFPSEM